MRTTLSALFLTLFRFLTIFRYVGTRLKFAVSGISIVFMLFTLSTTAYTLDNISWTISRWQQAIRQNDDATLQTMLTRIENVDQPTTQGKTALMAAAKQGNLELLHALLTAGANPNASNQNGGTPLLYAVAGGSLAATQRLQTAGASIMQRSSNGWSPLMMAVAKRRVSLVEYLLQAGADPNASDVYGWTPLMRAAYEGYQEVATLLLEQADISIEHINDHGQTALHLAVIGQRPALVELLLARKAAALKADFAKRTPLSIAIELNNQVIIALLTQAAGSLAPAQH